MLLLTTGVFVYGQNTAAEILGTITGQDRLPLAGVSLTITQVASGLERKVITDPQGHYAAPSLPVGEYTVRAHDNSAAVLRCVIATPFGRPVEPDV